jgi:cysteine-S-conjugate beta-lyase
MTFDFDEVVDRRGQWSLKWDRYAGRDVIPMWVADMDFRCPSAITDVLRARVDHGVFGYVEPGPELVETVAARLASSYGWITQPDWYVWLPGLVSGLNIVCRAVGEPGDDVLTGVPIYPPFLSAPLNSGRNCVRVPLACEDARWRFDGATLAQAITPRSRLLLLCNPHNPVGRVWSREELLALANIAAANDLTICSDEIHCGLVLDEDKPHVPLASVSPEIADRTITLMAASKTFNLPALGCAFAIVPNAQLRARLRRVMAGLVHRPLGVGLWATLAAYRDGEPWRLALVEYLRGNRDLVAERVATMPGLDTTHVEATYLAWIDCRGAGLEHPAHFFEAAGVGLYDGADFGAPGWVRLNFATRRALLVEALDRMRRALAAGIRTTR